MTNALQPNRPDALGILDDSRVPETVGAFQKSRYAEAVNRLVERLLFLQDTVQGQYLRGKRRTSTAPTKRSNTLKIYLRALEKWSYYSVGMWGFELDPREVTTDIATAYASWLKGETEGPDIRPNLVRALGNDYSLLFEAVAKTTQIYGQANILQIVEAIAPKDRSRFFRIPDDARLQPDLTKVHRMMGVLIRAFKTICRTPSAAQLRSEEGRIWTDREKDPLTYLYTLLPSQPLSLGGVTTNLGSLSAIWSEMTRKTSEEQSPLAFNPWRSVYARWARRLKNEKDNARLRGDQPILTTAIVRAMLNACRGPSLEYRRDHLAVTALISYGLRAEELAGLLRKDLVLVDGALHLAVLGKGNVVRQIRLDRNVQDAITALTAKLEDEAQATYVDDDGVRRQTYNAAYAEGLMSEEAPLIPSLARWGCNQRDRDAKADALEPLDISGVAAVLKRIAERSRVREIDSGIIRPLAPCEPRCKTNPCRHEMKRVHPHAFRHYAATAAQQSGVPLENVKETLGHKDFRTTQGYIEVSAQKSAAFSAGVFRTMNRQPALTPQEIENLRTKGTNPLEDRYIIEAEPEEQRVSSAGRPRQSLDARRVIESPRWAYEGGEVLEKHYLPPVNGRPGSPRPFSIEIKKRKAQYLEAQKEAASNRDVEAEMRATALYLEAASRWLFLTFRIGTDTRLPWWAGRKNNWPQGRMAPILSYAQIAPEDREQSELIKQLRRLHDRLWANQGPTAANAMIAWLSELLDIASTQFAKDMIERRDTWVLFDEPAAAGDPAIVREHAIEPVLEWFEQYGWALRVTIAKSGRNKGNIAIAAMDELDDWMWLPDPLLDLPADERKQLQTWVLELQGRRKSRVRFEQWIDQFSARVARWGKDKRAYELATGNKWSDSARSGTPQKLTKRRDSMKEDFVAFLPTLGRSPDFSQLSELSEADVRSTLRSMLAAEGIDAADPHKAQFAPAIRAAVGYLHPFDPGLLTFDHRATIVHDEPLKQFWYEKYGTDSECIVRRALRSLWERRKTSLRSLSPQLATKHFNAQLGAMIPCPKEMEQRIQQMGWKTPTTVDELLNASKTLWAGLVDHARALEGIAPVTNIPQQDVESFWAKEIDDFDAQVIAFTGGIPHVVEGPGAAVVLERIKLDSPELSEGLVRPPTYDFEKCVLPPCPADLQLYWATRACNMVDEQEVRVGTRLLDWLFEAEAQVGTISTVWEKTPTEKLIESYFTPTKKQEFDAIVCFRTLLMGSGMMGELEKLLLAVRPKPGQKFDIDADEQWFVAMRTHAVERQTAVFNFLDQARIPAAMKSEVVIKALLHPNEGLRAAAQALICGRVSECIDRCDYELQMAPVLLSSGLSGVVGQAMIRQIRSSATELKQIASGLLEYDQSYVPNAPRPNPDPTPASADPKKNPVSDESRHRQALLAAERISQAAFENADSTAIPIRLDDLEEVALTPTRLVVFGSDSGATAMTAEHLRKVLSTLRPARPSVTWQPASLSLRFTWGRKKGVQVAGMPLEEIIAKPYASAVVVQMPVGSSEQGQAPWYDDRPWMPRWPGYPLIDPEDEDTRIMRELPWPNATMKGLVATCVGTECMRRYAKWKRNPVGADEVPEGWQPGVHQSWSSPVPAAHPVDIVFAALRST